MREKITKAGRSIGSPCQGWVDGVRAEKIAQVGTSTFPVEVPDGRSIAAP